MGRGRLIVAHSGLLQYVLVFMCIGERWRSRLSCWLGRERSEVAAMTGVCPEEEFPGERFAGRRL